LQLEEDEENEDEAAEPSAQTNKALYKGEVDDNQGKAGRVPAHLQEKLPYPSENAMRRSMMSMPLLSWDAYQRGFQTGEDEEQQREGGIPEGQSRPVVSYSNRTRPPADEDDDGFGLDLN
jgi:hypothetical protein